MPLSNICAFPDPVCQAQKKDNCNVWWKFSHVELGILHVEHVVRLGTVGVRAETSLVDLKNEFQYL